MRERVTAAWFYAAGMASLLVGFSLGGDNGFVYLTSLLGVPVVSGALAGLPLIRFWHASAGCLAVVALDVAFDDTRAEDAVFFAILAVVMVGIAALARLVTGTIVRRVRPGSSDDRRNPRRAGGNAPRASAG